MLGSQNSASPFIRGQSNFDAPFQKNADSEAMKPSPSAIF